MIPANPQIFSKQLNSIRFPKTDEIRKPIEWILPMEKLDETREPCDWAAEQAYITMLNQIKLLQKLESDRNLTEKQLRLNKEEQSYWLDARNDLVKGIVEQFSTMEVIKSFPEMTTVQENGKVIFDLEKFKDLISVTEKGEIFIDEYHNHIKDLDKKVDLKRKETERLNNEVLVKTNKRLEESHIEFDKQCEKIQEECKNNEVLTEEEALQELTSKTGVIEAEDFTTLDHWKVDVEK
jgi:hypothetical protein